ncbi:MAG: tetratricopeptide repeat protein [Gammaproteobacteria bacterium]|nr:tetratricopeptide repeat protein [Gammaproteobacteria bacterium]
MSLEDQIAQTVVPTLFTRLCNTVFAAEYGHDYQPIDGTRGDGGNDGWLNSERRIFAIFCPLKPERKKDTDYLNKAYADLKKAALLRTNGRFPVERWTFVTPRKLSNDVISAIRARGEKLRIEANHIESTHLSVLFLRHPELTQEFPDYHVSQLEERLKQTLEMLGSTTNRAEAGVAFGDGARDNIVIFNDPDTILAAMQQGGVEARELREQLGVTDQALAAFFAILQREHVSREKLPETLTQIAKRHNGLLSRVAALEGDDADSQAHLESVRETIHQGRYEQAETMLADYDRTEAEAEARAAQTLAQRRLNRAAARALRGIASLTQLHYRDAVDHFRSASALVPDGFPDRLGEYLLQQAYSLVLYGDRQVGNDALTQAISVFQQALELLSRERVPVQWAMIQNDLGNVLCTLGERERDTANLEAAVTVYRLALQVYTREHVPLDWAMTQNNLGNALKTLGQRERDTANLEAAVAAYRLALEERTRERVPLAWAMTQNNLGNALMALGQRERGTANLRAAMAAYQLALQEYTREMVPLQWAETQNNLGNVLCALGERENDIANPEAAVSAYRLALEVCTRERVPRRWATTQSNLGNALLVLGQHERGTTNLHAAVTACQQALEELTREQAPLEWARTQNNLGNALYALGVRTANRGALENARVAVQNARQVYVADAGYTQYLEDFDRRLRSIDGALENIRTNITQ